ncbi:hypothetical protein ACZ90_02525 [Streptomyces albus subsp. albus]|nr:hypothetical protein ACZ90_02525 [Streptomyces albus subsp. albus]
MKAGPPDGYPVDPIDTLTHLRDEDIVSVQSIRPTDLPAGHRRTVHVDVSIPRPTSVAATFRAAARVLAANGLYQGGDYFPNALEYIDLFGLEDHVDDWADAEGRTTESAVAVLYAAADDSERVAA